MNKSIGIFAQQLADELTKAGRQGTAKSYICSVHSFLKFAGDNELNFSDLNQSLLKEYEQYLLNIGRTRNTVSLYLRMLRSICNQAVDRLKVIIPDNLFTDLFLGMDQGEKRSASLQVFVRLAKLDLGSKSTSLGFARDLFMLSFYLRGISFVDLANLRKEDVHEDVLYYRRSNTKRALVVPLEPTALSIIEKYSTYTGNSPYLLPILDSDEEKKYSRYQNALRWYNRNLDSLSQMLKLKYSLTSYVPRHSWAAAVYRQGFPVSVISESLGHTSERTTYDYLTSFDDRVLRQVNQKVISNIELSKEEEIDVLKVCKSSKRSSEKVSEESDVTPF